MYVGNFSINTTPTAVVGVVLMVKVSGMQCNWANGAMSVSVRVNCADAGARTPDDVTEWPIVRAGVGPFVLRALSLPACVCVAPGDAIFRLRFDYFLIGVWRQPRFEAVPDVAGTAVELMSADWSMKCRIYWLPINVKQRCTVSSYQIRSQHQSCRCMDLSDLCLQIETVTESLVETHTLSVFVFRMHGQWCEFLCLWKPMRVAGRFYTPPYAFLTSNHGDRHCVNALKPLKCLLKKTWLIRFGWKCRKRNERVPDKLLMP